MSSSKILQEKVNIFLTFCINDKGYPYKHETFLTQMRNTEISAVTMGKEVIDYIKKNNLAVNCYAIEDGNRDNVTPSDYSHGDKIYYFYVKGTTITDAGQKWLREHSKI